MYLISRNFSKLIYFRLRKSVNVTYKDNIAVKNADIHAQSISSENVRREDVRIKIFTIRSTRIWSSSECIFFTADPEYNEFSEIMVTLSAV